MTLLGANIMLSILSFRGQLDNLPERFREQDMYAVREIFYTLQGEGANAGTAAVFCRFAGCNLWSGREADRAGAVCQFCDTNFVGTDGEGGGSFECASQLVDAILSHWCGGDDYRFVVLTGGEPTLQVDDELVSALQRARFRIGIETNGTRPLPFGIDWICVSPKAGTELKVTSGHELKLIYPQHGLSPESVAGLHFANRFLQPLDGPRREDHTALAVAYCKAHPEWRLSLQTHKLIGIP